MGYTTEFQGGFKTSEPLPEEFVNFINKFSNTRHMDRDEERVKALYPDWEKQCFNGSLGGNAQYFVGDDGNDVHKYPGFGGQGDPDTSILNANHPASGVPGLWCQWVIADDMQTLEWDGNEKFYNFVEWLEYLIKHFFAPSGYVLNGEAMWQGEDINDRGKIFVRDNIVTTEFLE